MAELVLGLDYSSDELSRSEFSDLYSLNVKYCYIKNYKGWKFVVFHKIKIEIKFEFNGYSIVYIYNKKIQIFKKQS